MLEEAAKRDHRKLGVELDLFSFPNEIGGGLAVWHPKGGIIRRVLEEYSRQRHEQGGYEFVYTPHISKSTLFEISGHLEWYAEGMYPPMEMEGATYYPKPMNCPGHIMIYKARGKSYRELPLRMFEFGTVYRFEKSGVLHGLTRARGFTQDDSHIFCTPEQLNDELASLLKFVVDLLRDFGLTEFTAELSTRPDKYVGELEEWTTAEAALKHALDVSGLPYTIAEGEGAFYAPKIDVHIKDAIGRRWQLSTLQVDLQMPSRFDMEFQAADGTRQRPYMIHRALFGSEERFFAILLEHYAGALPPWLAPVQVVAIPITDAHVPYLQEVAAQLARAGDPGRGRHLRRPDAEEDPHRAEAEGALHAARGRRGREQRRRVVPLPQRRAEQRGRDRRRDRGDHPGGARAGPGLTTGVGSGVSEEQHGAGTPDAFERLWTPHRMAYIGGENKPAGDPDDPAVCPFCRIPADGGRGRSDRRPGRRPSTSCSTCTPTTPAT